MARKIKWLDRDIITGPYITLCTSYDEYVTASQQFRKHDISAPFRNQGRCEAFYHKGKLVIIVVIQGVVGWSLEECIGLIVHEASHTSDHLFEDLGEKTPSAEFKAYTIQTISQTLTVEFLSRVNLSKTLTVVSMKKEYK